jgi:hypothetical protein
MATDHPLLGTKYVNQFVRVQGEKDRVVNDHSFLVGASNNENQPGEKTVIDGLDRLVSFLAVYHLGMKSLGYDKTHKIVIRKFDFQAAYRQVPLHPVAALKQAVKTKGGATLYDLYAAFGMKNAGNMWNMICSLVIHCLSVLHLQTLQRLRHHLFLLREHLIPHCLVLTHLLLQRLVLVCELLILCLRSHEELAIDCYVFTAHSW